MLSHVQRSPCSNKKAAKFAFEIYSKLLYQNELLWISAKESRIKNMSNIIEPMKLHLD